MEEIKLVKKYPNIRDEDVTEIFQEGYLKGFENGRKKAIPIEWLVRKYEENITIWKMADTVDESFRASDIAMAIELITELWEKENGNID